MSDCRKCADFEWCAKHEDCGLFKPKPESNADRIRSMTDEELATLLTDVVKKSAEKLCESLKTVDVDISNCDFDILYKTHLDLLRQECER